MRYLALPLSENLHQMRDNGAQHDLPKNEATTEMSLLALSNEG